MRLLVIFLASTFALSASTSVGSKPFTKAQQRAIEECVGRTGVGTGNIWQNGVCIRDYFAKLPKATLTEAEIAPCNELLSYRGARESKTISNLEFALHTWPFEPLYDLKGVKYALRENAESIAAVESGSAEAQLRNFGVVYTGQDAIDRLMGDRRHQCLLNVRLRQLQGSRARPRK